MMKILAGNPTGAAKQQAIARGVGAMLCTSGRKHMVTKAVDEFPFWALDNGAFGAFKRGVPFPEDLFREQLERARQRKHKPLFVVTPDIIAGGETSLELSVSWIPRIQGLPKALVVQDGMRPEAVAEVIAPFDYLFVGGTVAWKWKTAKGWVQQAHSHGKPCHIGQCGQFHHLCEARRIGADSVDSTSWVVNKSWHHIDTFHAHLQALPF